MKHLVGKTITKSVDFLGDKVEIKQLSVGAVLKLQKELAKADELDSIETIGTIVRTSVIGAEDLSDEDFQSFPLGELLKLSEEIMAFAGLKAESGND